MLDSRVANTFATLEINCCNLERSSATADSISVTVRFRPMRFDYNHPGGYDRELGSRPGYDVIDLLVKFVVVAILVYHLVFLLPGPSYSELKSIIWRDLVRCMQEYGGKRTRPGSKNNTCNTGCPSTWLVLDSDFFCDSMLVHTD